MSILIKGVKVVDGTGAEPYKADVFVDKNLISAIGDLKGKEADEVIDGLGNYLVPGFIDIDTSSDHYLSLLTNPLQNDFSKQGVTTAIGGHCGSSLAPLLYGTLESIRKWTDVSQVNVNWHSVEEFLNTLGNFPLGVNFGTMIGHSTVRRSIIGEAQRELAQEEISVFKKIITKGMNEGAFGLSTGLGYAHGKHTPYNEIKELAEVVKSFEGVYSTHLRDEKSAVIPSVDEIIRIAKETGVKTIISHFRPLIGFESQFDKAFSEMQKNYSDVNIRSYVYPFDSSLEALYKLLPSWAQEKNLENMLGLISKSESLWKIEADLKDIDPTRIIIADAPKHDYLVGKTLVELSEVFELSPVKTLIKVMETTKLRCTVINKNINYSKLLDVLKDDKVFIASNGASRIGAYKFVNHERSTDTFTKYFEIVLGENAMTFPQAVRRVTQVPAEYFGIKDRGVIKEGKIADLTILDKNDYKPKDVIVGGKSTFGVPLRHNK